MKQSILSACAVLAILSSCARKTSENPDSVPACIQPASLKEGDKITIFKNFKILRCCLQYIFCAYYKWVFCLS